MYSEELALKVSSLSKCYRIYERPQDRLKQFVASALKHLGGEGTVYGKEFTALEDVSFEIHKGETVGIIGRNGSGKSTLLQLICGTLSPTSGIVETSGRVAALLELGAGFNPEFTGRENVYLNGSILGLTQAEITDRFEAIAAFAGIGLFMDQAVKTYSSGMYVRLAFSVMAHVDADILVIDEALAVGDVFFMQKCMRFLRKFQEKGTILFVSHDTSAVVNLCQRALWLDRGAVREFGSAKIVCEHYLATSYSQDPVTSLPRVEIPSSRAETDSVPPVDMRAEWINRSCLRNDIEVFRFSGPDRSFGSGGASIVNVSLVDPVGRVLSWVVGGEKVEMTIEVNVLIPISSMIVGFFFKDRLGQVLFGDNTYLVYNSSPFAARAGDVVVARFSFRMPILPRGTYAVDVAIADGSYEEHVQHQWIHDAVTVESHSSSTSTGLVGIPFEGISLERMN
jgi:lipopolysaccharide transport system ATP-binding protein